MKDGQWKDWTEPLEVLLANVKEFIDTLKLTSSLIDMPIGGKLIEGQVLRSRREKLNRALAAFIMYSRDQKVWTSDFLDNYIYVSDVYRDAMAIVFEYMGENEHQMGLHGDEFAQTKDGLLKDFAMYIVESG